MNPIQYCLAQYSEASRKRAQPRAKADEDVSLRETSHAVDVVPMFAPSSTPRLEGNDIGPASTKAVT